MKRATSLFYRNACETWMRTLNAIPQTLIEQAYAEDMASLIELTQPVVGQEVYVLAFDTYGTVREVKGDYCFVQCGETSQWVEQVDLDLYYDSWLPMWGTLWMFGSACDEAWALQHLQLLSQCGFRIFYDDTRDFLFIGIDGAGYDFYEAHWLPLYEACHELS